MNHFKLNLSFIRRLFLLILISWICQTLSAQIVTINNLSYYLSGSQAWCRGFAENVPTSGELIIPDEVEYETKTYAVTQIMGQAFRNETGITSLKLGKNITVISSNAFYQCSNIEGPLELPSSLVTIDINAFAFCSKLSGPLYIPNSVTTIKANAFQGCVGFTEFSLGTGITTLESAAFSGCSGLTGEVTIPEAITEIPGSLFAGCSSISAFHLHDGITSIGTFAFDGCSGWNGNLNLPSKLTAINEGSFQNCSSITSITIPSKVTTIWKSAFKGCSGIKGTLCIPDNVTYIYDYAFRDCIGLTSLQLGDGISSLYAGAFYGCSGLSGTINLPEKVKVINNYLFYKCSNIERIIFGSEVTSIGNRSFEDCKALSGTLEIPNTVTKIGDYAFYGCLGLTSVTVGSEVKTIGTYSLSCSNLTSIISLAETPCACQTNSFYMVDKTIPVVVPEGTLNSYKAATGWKDFVNLKEHNADPYVLTYYVDNEIYETQYYFPGDLITPPTNPEKTGYTFEKWVDLPETMPSQNLIVYAVFNINSYSITFMIEDNEYHKASFEYDAPIILPDSPTKEGFSFNGWNGIPERMPAENIIVYAIFDINSYKLSYFLDGEFFNEQTWNFGETIIPLQAPNKNGYTFGGWNTLPSTMPAKNVEVEGYYSINSYELTYMVNDTVYKKVTYPYEAIIQSIEPPTKKGHTFTGWSGLPERMPNKDIVVVATFDINVYKISYYVDSIFYNEASYAYGEQIKALPNPQKEGYSFSGWTNIPVLMPSENIDVYGFFSPNSHKVTFMMDDKIYSSILVEFGKEIPLPDMPEKEGFTFVSWSGLPEKMPDEEVIVYATFSVNSYTLTYYLDDEFYNKQTLAFGSPINIISAPEREGYSFSGWTDIPESMPAKDLRVDGYMNVNSYQISYFIDNELYFSQILEFGSEIIPPYVEVNEDRKFLGWTTQIPATMPAENLEIYGTTVEKDSGIDNITEDDEQFFDVYDLSGFLLSENLKESEVKQILKKGIYILINKTTKKKVSI